MADPYVFVLRFPQLVTTRLRFPPPDLKPGLVIVGPRGDRGIQGPPGEAGDGTYDPGDLVLIFENHLI